MADEGVLHETGEDEHHEEQLRRGKDVGRLGGRMVYAIHVRASRGHDRGVGVGEQWPPATAPARQAEMPTVSSVGSSEKMGSTMGMRMPNASQLVPVENAKNTAAKKMTAGNRLSRPEVTPSIMLATKTSIPKRSVMFFGETASVNTRMTETVALRPTANEA